MADTISCREVKEFESFLPDDLRKRFNNRTDKTPFQYLDVGANGDSFVRRITPLRIHGIRVDTESDIVPAAYALAQRLKKIDRVAPVLASLSCCNSIEIYSPSSLAAGVASGRYTVDPNPVMNHIVVIYFFVDFDALNGLRRAALKAENVDFPSYVDMLNKLLVPEGGCPPGPSEDDLKAMEEYRRLHE